MHFDPTGRILQVEYAKDAVNRGGPIIGIKCTDGIILVACRKDRFPVLQLNRIQKLFLIDDHICIAATGLLFDARVIIDFAKLICLEHREYCNSPIPIEKLIADLSQLTHSLTKRTTSRALGAGKL